MSVRVTCSVCVSSYWSGRGEWSEGSSGLSLFQLCTISRQCFWIQVVLVLGFFLLSGVRSFLLTFSALTLPCLTEELISLNDKLLSSSQMIYFSCFSLVTDLCRAPSWLRIKSKHHYKASSLRSRILIYLQSYLLSCNHPVPSACIDPTLWSNWTYYRSFCACMLVNMPFPSPPIPFFLPIPSGQNLLILENSV